MKSGLYEVTQMGDGRGIYQVRNYGLANTTFVEGNETLIVIDTLMN